MEAIFIDEQSNEIVTLREWIEISWPTSSEVFKTPTAPALPGAPLYDYIIESAIPLALKLTECFIAEDRQPESACSQTRDDISIPLASISSENIVIHLKDGNLEDPLTQALNQQEDLFLTRQDAGAASSASELVWDKEAEDNFNALLDEINEPGLTSNEINENEVALKSDKVVDQVKIMPREVHSSDVGNKMSRLFSLGKIFYEIFSGERPFPGLETLTQSEVAISKATVQGINLSHDVNKASSSSSSKINSSNIDLSLSESSKSRKLSSNKFKGANKTLCECVGRLEFIGIPHSLCSLIGNLLDCVNGQFCEDDAYRSFTDIYSDLQLMLDDPSRFLQDINISSPQQTLTFSYCNKIYGRDEEITKIENAHKRGIRGECRGVVITGEAGVGKSELARHVIEKLTTRANRYFISGKFDQNQDLKPLSVIGSAFDKCCVMFESDCNSQQEKIHFALEIQNALGGHLSALLELLPSLSRILPLTSSEKMRSPDCVDPARRLRFMLCTLVQILSSVWSRHITLFLDDLQWADPSSLLLIRSLLANPKISKHFFFVCCFREGSDDFELWHHSISLYSMTQINLKNLDEKQVNRYTSDLLRLSPRLTLPLSSILLHKTRGNPLFLRQILESLKTDGHIYFSLKLRRWAWDIEKITNLQISDNVVELLMKDMIKLPDDLQLGLNVAACMGGTFNKDLIDILSQDIGIDLRAVFSQVLKMGFIDDLGTKYCFSHDRIQQAAYEMIPSEQRDMYHLRFGLAICAHSLDCSESDEEFFIAVNQINRGGLHTSSLPPAKKSLVSSLNLKAGKKCFNLSDFPSALKFFEHGISFLNLNHWDHQYELSLDLHGFAAEAGCIVNDSKIVHQYSEKVLTHARGFEDKLNTLYVMVRSFLLAELLYKAKSYAFQILSKLGEGMPQPVNNSHLKSNIIKMGDKLNGMEDEIILNLKWLEKKSVVTLMKLYRTLIVILHQTEPFRIPAVSLRMVELTLSQGLCSMAPIGLAQFGVCLISMKTPSSAYRVGSLSLRLLEKMKLSGCSANASEVISTVHQFISWTSEPFQSIPESHLLGYRAGKQSGDTFASAANYQFFLMSSFLSGKSLAVVKKNSRDFIDELVSQKQDLVLNAAILLHLLTVALTEGPHVSVNYDSGQFLSVSDILELARSTRKAALLTTAKIHRLLIKFFHRQKNEISEDDCVSKNISRKKSPFRMFFVVGIFFEGLVSFHMARQSKGDKWLARGEAALKATTWWSQYSSWNFENKVLLLESEKMFSMGNFAQASNLYDAAIQSSRDHMFLQEEAIACELAGMFYFERRIFHKSHKFLSNSCDIYRRWGATSVAERIEQFMINQLGSGVSLPLPECKKGSASESIQDNMKRRQSNI